MPRPATGAKWIQLDPSAEATTMTATTAKTSSKGSPINWTKVIAEAAAAKAETLQQQAKG